LGNWEASDLAYVEVRDDGFSLDGPYLYLGRYGHWAATDPFTVPVDAQSVHFDYTSWANRNHAESAAIYVYALSGPNYSVVTELGSFSGSLKDGWRKAVLDLQAYRGQSIRLRFRTYWGNANRNDKARVDNVRLAVEVPDWQAASTVYGYVAVRDDAFSLDGQYLYLGRYGYWAATEPILIPEDAQSVRFDYMNWTSRNHSEDTALYVHALSGPGYGVVVELGSVTGNAADGWRSATLDVRAFRGQSIRLRFRTYWGNANRNDKSRVDNVALAVQVPGWEPSLLGYARTSDQDWPEDPGLTEPDNLLFEQGTTLLPTATYPPNYDFGREREMSDASTYPPNYDLGTGDLGNWEASD
ncbi:MAG: hypothetical protein GY842_14675, partial [bacterium]|nr:hypothetical protein [bacterium]